MRLRTFALLALIIVAGCGDDGHPSNPGGGSDGGVIPPDAPPAETVCENLPATTSGQTCDITAGNTSLLIKGNILTPSTVYRGGQVLVDATGKIACTGCDCAAGGETVISCPDGAVSPGLINTHDHITYTQNSPHKDTTGERYDDRQQWRTGKEGHTKIPAPGGASAAQVQWGELRFLMGGATSIVGSGGQKGLLRNLDQAANMEAGLSKKAVNFDTFPLDDTNGLQQTMNCNYGSSPTTADSISANDAYEPHTSEGIDVYAHNEFLCESSTTYDTLPPGVSNNLVLAKTSMIHAIGLTAQDYSTMAAAGTGMIWSPRSNIVLYGDTARVEVASKLGVNIALGTDWMPSGSMNLLRELKCADNFNQTYLHHYFDDKTLWQMVTSNAAQVVKMDDSIGVLAAGHLADISIFKGNGKTYRAVIDAQPADVALVLRAGKTLYGDANLVSTLSPSGCDTVDVCSSSKEVCLMGEVGQTYQGLMAAANVYPAFSCDATPQDEPSCLPVRPNSVSGSTVYTGVASATDTDGDGIPDANDLCPDVFDPVRPMDNGAQADADGDGVGDACDPCPLDANTTQCTGTVDPNDRDGDGVPNTADNCPDVANPDQLDTDHDGKGDVCDACPSDANPGAEGCPASIYAIKMGSFAAGTSVTIHNALVTAKGTNGFFVQVKEGDTGYQGSDYSGIFIFTNTGTTLQNTVVGTRVSVSGTIDTFQAELEIDNVTAVTVDSATVEAPPALVTATYAEVKTGGTRSAKLEGVLVQLGAASVTAFNTQYGEATLTAPDSSTLIMDDFVFNAGAAVGQNYASVAGVYAIRNSAGTILPRAAGDVVIGAPGLASLTPGLSFAKVGTTTNANTYPQALTVNLSAAAMTDTTVALASGDATSLTVPATVTVLAGQTSVTVPVTANVPAADVTVTAMLGMTMQTAHVRVLGATEAPTKVLIDPTDAGIGLNGTKDFTVSLDVPPAADTVVNLSVNPASGTLPATVTINANTLAKTFTYTNTATSGTATITAASSGLTSATATVTVSTGANHLVINEIDYDNKGTDTAEFVEIYNPSGSTIDLTGKALMLVNGSNNEVYGTVDLSTAGTLAPLSYLVIAGGNVTVPGTAKKINPGWNQDAIQNGAPDGMAIVDTTNLTVIDAVSYEGSITAAQLTGFGAVTTNLVEGTAMPLTVLDNNTDVGTSICRSPNGQDTDNASADWKVCTTLSVGTANP